MVILATPALPCQLFLLVNSDAWNLHECTVMPFEVELGLNDNYLIKVSGDVKTSVA